MLSARFPPFLLTFRRFPLFISNSDYSNQSIGLQAFSLINRSSVDQLGRHRTRNRKVVGLIPANVYLEEQFVSQMLIIDNVFSALLSIDGLCENK